MGRKWLVLVGVVVVIVVIVILGKNIIAKSAMSGAINAATGLRAEIGSMKVGVFNSRVDIEGLRLLNPEGFEEELMADIPTLYVDYDMGALLERKVHIEELRVNVREFVIVKNKDGKLNIDALKGMKAEEGKVEEKPTAPEKQIQIDSFELKVGKVVYKDYTQSPPKVMEFPVNLDEKYENITDPRKLTYTLVARALLNTAIGKIADIDVGPFLEKMEGVGKELGEKARETTEKIKKMLPLGGEK